MFKRSGARAELDIEVLEKRRRRVRMFAVFFVEEGQNYSLFYYRGQNQACEGWTFQVQLGLKLF